MTDREPELLSRYFEGAIPREALPESLRREAERFEDAMATLARGPLRLPATLRHQVMDEVRVIARSPGRRLWSWLVQPQMLRVRPLPLAVGALAAAILLAVALSRSSLAPAPARATAPARFVFLAPEASRVAVTGDFAGWDPEGIPLTRGTSGIWTGEYVVEPGVHHYVFIVDGTRWQPDPNAPSRVDDGFGSENSVLVVPGGEASS